MVRTECLITNGYPDTDSILDLIGKGWYIVQTIDATLVHPHALQGDYITFFARYEHQGKKMKEKY